MPIKVNFLEQTAETQIPREKSSTRACMVPLDACRWTPKGETNGLSTLNVQKAYQFDVGDTVSVFCGRREKISIIHNNNQTENLVYSEDNFSTYQEVVVCVCRGGKISNLPQQ